MTLYARAAGTIEPGNMLSSRNHRLSFLLATVVALRAFVPVGYMLSLPVGGSSQLALHLCPIQNPTLDLSRFSSLDTPGSGQHRHAAHHTASGTEDETTVSFSADCRAWLASATATFMASTAALVDQFPLIVPPTYLDTALPGHSRQHAAQVRAPPTFSS